MRTSIHGEFDCAKSKMKTIERLMDEGFILVGAGGETTAQTLAVLTFHLLNNPRILLELRAELDEAVAGSDSLLSWQTLEQLPFLVREGIILARLGHHERRLLM